ncbi:DUF1990 family protein [Streptomyces sp. SCUT-3]|uniref:DUF1990 family protein n=1 Tax=Streptomyces sp. SCUT-3 TaxID=2684469 RepID=UPI000CBBD93C|nr:DUF1990 domain-containing protein [Streptomyces sp. SCUT-3]PLW74373.1 DUF1990 domain-containing protein [Streptomyces sp. DJ]QMV20625.1 DUF1990 family protein [Streptomyces sp. SCUT-3]
MGPFDYPGVGATRDPALLPPAGYRLLRVRTRIGSGEGLVAAAGQAVLDWRMHRAVGVRIEASAPVAAPGVRVTVGLGFGPLLLRAPCEVVWSVREDDRVGFAYGTLPGHPECGEEAFVVERDTDGTVRLSVTAFSRPALWYTRAAGPAVRLFQRAYAGRCGTVLRELTGQFDGK